MLYNGQRQTCPTPLTTAERDSDISSYPRDVHDFFEIDGFLLVLFKTFYRVQSINPEYTMNPWVHAQLQYEQTPLNIRPSMLPSVPEIKESVRCCVTHVAEARESHLYYMGLDLKSTHAQLKSTDSIYIGHPVQLLKRPSHSSLLFLTHTNPSFDAFTILSTNQSAFGTVFDSNQQRQITQSSSTVAQQFVMQTTITKQEMEEQLASISTLFDMPTSGGLDIPGYGGVSNASNIAHHSRSISSESASSSLAGHEHPTRYHPSLGYNPRRISPEGHVLERSSAPQTRRQQPTTHREVPSYIATRHRRQPVPSDDEDDIDEEPLRENATEQEKIEYKRRQNTLAARRSRRRRLAQFRQLEDDVTRLNREKEIWKERALMMERILSNNGLPCPNFER